MFCNVFRYAEKKHDDTEHKIRTQVTHSSVAASGHPGKGSYRILQIVGCTLNPFFSKLTVRLMYI